MGNEYPMLKVGMVIIARDHSTRLPGKALADVEGKPALLRMVERVRKANYITDVIIATSDDSPRIIDFCKENNIHYSVGSVEDVLDRTYKAAKKYELDIVVRSWGDCILIDPYVVNEVINDHLSFGYDYTYNVGYPKGLNCGVLDFSALEKAWKEIKLPSDRMFFQRWFAKNLKTREYKYYKTLDSISWCVDYAEDLEFVRYVFREMQLKGHDNFRWKEVLGLWEKWNNECL